MTDEQNWQAPGAQPATGDGAAGSPPPPYSPPQPYSPPEGWASPPQPPQQGWAPQPQAWAPQGQQGWTPPPPQPGWAPPPKPGLIPLRPLGFGTLIGAPFQVIRRNPKVTVAAALLLQGLPSILGTLLVSGGAGLLVDRALNGTDADRGALAAGAVAGALVLAILGAVITGISGALLQGVIVGEVARGTVGERLSFRQLWSMVKGRLGALIGWTFLVALGWLVVIAAIGFASAGLIALGPIGIGAAVILIIVAFFGLVVLAVWFFTKAALVPSAILLERLPIRAALPRSFRLTRGYFWRTFGVLALIAVIVSAVTQIISTPFGILGGLVGGILDPTSTSPTGTSTVSAMLVSQVSVNILSTVVASIVGAVLAVAQTSAVALVYIDLRMRTEGLDLQLTRFVEARQAGHEAPDPYLAPAPTA